MSFDPNPYSPSSNVPTAPKKSRVLLYVLLGIGGVLLLMCCGGGGFLTLMFNAGAKEASKVARAQFQSDPAIQEHIGELESVEVDLGAAYSELQKNQKRHQGRDMAFKVKGTKGEGVVMGRFDRGTGRINDGELILSSGEFFPLSP